MITIRKSSLFNYFREVFTLLNTIIRILKMLLAFIYEENDSYLSMGTSCCLHLDILGNVYMYFVCLFCEIKTKGTKRETREGTVCLKTFYCCCFVSFGLVSRRWQNDACACYSVPCLTMLVYLRNMGYVSVPLQTPWAPLCVHLTSFQTKQKKPTNKCDSFQVTLPWNENHLYPVIFLKKQSFVPILDMWTYSFLSPG